MLSNIFAEVEQRVATLSEMICAEAAEVGRQFFRAREWCDRREIGKFVETVEQTHKLSNDDFKHLLGWGEGEGHLQHAKHEGRIGTPKYHRLLVDFREEFRPGSAMEGNHVDLMWAVYSVGKRDQGVPKRRMHRDVFEWVRAIRQEEDLLRALLVGDLSGTERLVRQIEERVERSLKAAVVHGLQAMRKEGDQLRVAVRSERRRKAVKADASDIQRVIWEWYPAFRAVDDCLTRVRPAWYAFRWTRKGPPDGDN